MGVENACPSEKRVLENNLREQGGQSFETYLRTTARIENVEGAGGARLVSLRKTVAVVLDYCDSCFFKNRGRCYDTSAICKHQRRSRMNTLFFIYALEVQKTGFNYPSSPQFVYEPTDLEQGDQGAGIIIGFFCFPAEFERGCADAEGTGIFGSCKENCGTDPTDGAVSSGPGCLTPAF